MPSTVTHDNMNVVITDQDQPATPIKARQEQKAPTLKERWRELVKQHGLFKGTRYLFVPGANELDVVEEKLSFDVQILIYAVSLIALFVTGSQEVIEILTGASASKVIAGVILGLFFLAIISMDRSFARSIPRIPLLAQRGEWFMVIEHSLFVCCVALIEIGSIFVLSINEPHLLDILRGKPLINPDSMEFDIVAGARSVLIIWTIAHSYLASKKLPPLFKSFKEVGAIKIASALLKAIGRMGDSLEVMKFRALYNTGAQLYRNPVRAPKTMFGKDGKQDKTYNRAAKQKELDDQYEKELMDAFEKLENAQPELQSAPPTLTKAALMETITNAIRAVEVRFDERLMTVVDVVEKQLLQLTPNLAIKAISTASATPRESSSGAARTPETFWQRPQSLRGISCRMALC